MNAWSTLTRPLVVFTVFNGHHLQRTADKDRDRHALGVDGGRKRRCNGAIKIALVDNIHVDDSNIIVPKRAPVEGARQEIVKRALAVVVGNLHDVDALHPPVDNPPYLPENTNKTMSNTAHWLPNCADLQKYQV